MSTFIIKRKTFAYIPDYDATDNLKRMKDSDLLAEQRKEPTTTRKDIINSTIKGAIAGGAGFGAVNGLMKGGLGAAGRGALWGVGIGAAAGALKSLNQRGKEKKQNQFYNNRLAYAQRQAMRRERKDWKANMTQRDGYSY